jgi:hypothetical protein
MTTKCDWRMGTKNNKRTTRFYQFLSAKTWGILTEIDSKGTKPEREKNVVLIVLNLSNRH